ncbi:uncharacterized protein TNCV_1270351 [Trichonephila clavipes]|nr:uncharacterized protein TNCV_1270351 [Trichonephila clavipes]
MYSTFSAWGTLKSLRAASPLVRLGQGKESWEAPDHTQGVLPQNWGGIELNSAVTCMVLKAKSNDSRTAPCQDVFHRIGFDAIEIRWYMKNTNFYIG